jgi:hypothetical protein
MPSRWGLPNLASAVLVRVCQRRLLPKGREAPLEVPDVSREFPRATVLKFSMSGLQNDTLCYKIGSVA